LSWEDQGRQERGWFGHGTGPANSTDASGAGARSDHAAQRIQAIAYGAIAALPRSLRKRAETQHDAGSLSRLAEVMTAWSDGAKLGEAEFAERFFGRDADDPVAEALHGTARAVSPTSDRAAVQQAAEQLAAAMQTIGLDRWQRFLADARQRAHDPATRTAVAASQRQAARLAEIRAEARPAPAQVADREAAPAPGAAAEPEHGRIWWWLHGLGLANTRHEQATLLRRAMGAQGGRIYMLDGVPLNVEQMSDDEVLALEKETRGQPIGPPLVGAAAPIMTQWGWNNSAPYNAAKNQLKQPGTHKTLNGRVPTREEAVRMIEETGGRVDRTEEGHHPDGDSSHHEPHINYTTGGETPLGEKKATVIVKPWK